MEKVLGVTTKKRYEGKALHSEIFLCKEKRTQDYLLGSFYYQKKTTGNAGVAKKALASSIKNIYKKTPMC